MTPEQQAAFIYSQSTAAMICAMGMHAENSQRMILGQSIAYPESAFTELIEDHSLGYNTVMELFTR